jgi:hypothetical protein
MMRIVAKSILGDQDSIALSDKFIVEFGDGAQTIAIAVRDGVVDVRSPSGCAISIEPRAANSVWVRAITSPGRGA